MPAGKGTLNSHPTHQECSWSDGIWDGCQRQWMWNMAAAKQDLGVLCKAVLKQNLPQYPTSTPCPELRLCLPMTRLTAVELAVKRKIHHFLEWEKQRSPSPGPGAAQPQGVGDSWDWPQFHCLLKSPPNHPTQPSWGAGRCQGHTGKCW